MMSPGPSGDRAPEGGTLRSAIFEARERLAVVDVATPEPGEGEVLLRVRYCGICGTDVRAYREGRHIPFGTVMGHELCGEIVARGRGVRGHALGGRVAVNPMPRCGRCFHCARGEYTLCEAAVREEIGFSPEHPGGLAEHVLVRHPDEMLVPLPDAVSFEQAALAEPLAVSLHAVRMSRHAPGGSALVIGAGMIGLGVVAFLRRGGAGRILAADLSATKLARAGRMGADALLQPASGDDLVERARALCGGVGPDVVFECAGTASTFRLAPRCARKGGQVIVAGFCDEEVPLSPLELVLRAIELKAVLGYHDDFEEVVRFLEGAPFDPADLVTDVVGLDDVDARGFRRVLADPEAIRILVRP
jgi:(R,R)-butanediol dehydrogenase/meso-butanediol dehydrogenase/diacetyl reductase